MSLSLNAVEFPDFYGCYLLRSLKLRCKNHCYVGSTPDPIRRLKQHNGELSSGAKKTCKKRPWEMVLIVHGFPSNLAALQFEWAWQYPHRSRHLSQLRGKFSGQKKEAFLPTKLEVLIEMLNSNEWKRWPLKIRFLKQEVFSSFESLNWPNHVPISVGALENMAHTFADEGEGEGRIQLDEFNKYMALESGGVKCAICLNEIEIKGPICWATCQHSGCTMYAHLTCLAENFVQNAAKIDPSEEKQLLPIHGSCPTCRKRLYWGDIIRAVHALRSSLLGSGTLAGYEV
ncbi:hypothetical protein K493DRAFT_258586, partial [Basidiobolus meristosporus CBS 931.73]